jgi:hypothetical protein
VNEINHSQLIYDGKSKFDGLSIASEVCRCLRPVSIQFSDTGSDVRNESLHVSPKYLSAFPHSTAFNQHLSELNPYYSIPQYSTATFHSIQSASDYYAYYPYYPGL